MHFKATKADIGRFVYPVDNSYSQDLATGKMPEIGEERTGLAGNYRTLRYRVEIIYGPFILTTHSSISNRLLVDEFCIVRYEGKDYLVLNNFTTEQIPDYREEYELDPGD